MQNKKVVIVGGGFGGVRAALDLARQSDIEVVLISKNHHFEYYPGLHKMVGISERATVHVPLESIFKDTGVTVVIGEAVEVNPITKTVVTTRGSFHGDFLILALGSQTEYFGIPGLREMSYGFKSVEEARKLRHHIENCFKKHAHAEKAESVVGLHFVVVGAGPNGVDVAGELAVLGKEFAKKYKIPESLMTIDLVEGNSRVLPMLSEDVSHHVHQRLRELGVDVLCNRDLVKEDAWTVSLADMKIGAKTLIWTAGIITNELVKKIPGFQLTKKDRVIVDEYLQAKDFENVFIVGDAAETPYAGLAQTALYDGEFVANVISYKMKSKKPRVYVPHPNAFNIGVGPRWSVMMVGSFVMYGLIPYLLRTLIDIRFFLSILSPSKVWDLYQGKHS